MRRTETKAKTTEVQLDLTCFPSAPSPPRTYLKGDGVLGVIQGSVSLAVDFERAGSSDVDLGGEAENNEGSMEGGERESSRLA